MVETWNPWGDGPISDEELDSYSQWLSNLHDFVPGPNNKCLADYTLRDGTVKVCNASSHSTTHNPLPCCHCIHGVYLHTSYDIPCGECEMGASGGYE